MGQDSLAVKYIRQIDSEVEAIEEHILSGAYATLDQYKAAVAQRTAWLSAKEMFKETLRRANSEEDHDV